MVTWSRQKLCYYTKSLLCFQSWLSTCSMCATYDSFCQNLVQLISNLNQLGNIYLIFEEYISQEIYLRYLNLNSSIFYFILKIQLVYIFLDILFLFYSQDLVSLYFPYVQILVSLYFPYLQILVGITLQLFDYAFLPDLSWS